MDAQQLMCFGVYGSRAPALEAPVTLSDMSDTASLTQEELDRRHHLLRHSLPDTARGETVLVHFEATSVHEAVKMIKKMSQRDLQAKFKLVYGAKTFSNNNNWLRRKLFEAIGVDPAKGAVKKAVAGSSGGRRRRGGAAQGAVRVARAPRGVRGADMDWFAPRSSAMYDRGAPLGQYWSGEPEVEVEADEDDDDEEHCHVAEALLALGGSGSSSPDESCSLGTGSVDMTPTEQVVPKAPQGIKHEDPGALTACHRLMLGQHAQRLHYAGAPAVAEWLAMVQQHSLTAGGAGLLLPHVPPPASQLAHGWHGMQMMPVFQAPAVQHNVLNALRNVMAAQHAGIPSTSPFFAAAAAQ